MLFRSQAFERHRGQIAARQQKYLQTVARLRVVRRQKLLYPRNEHDRARFSLPGQFRDLTLCFPTQWRSARTMIWRAS